MRNDLGEEACFSLERGNMIDFKGEFGLSGNGSRQNQVTGRWNGDRVLDKTAEIGGGHILGMVWIPNVPNWNL